MWCQTGRERASALWKIVKMTKMFNLCQQSWGELWAKNSWMTQFVILISRHFGKWWKARRGVPEKKGLTTPKLWTKEMILQLVGIVTSGCFCIPELSQFLRPRTMNATVWRGSADECVRLQKEELFCQWLEALQVLKQKVKKQKPTERDPFLSGNERARCRPHLRTPLHPLRSASYKR